jgi:tetratricopeptide (TPR) repeat protein/tRNA A-37 threonylcarbamoyl transferase component Bud32
MPDRDDHVLPTDDHAQSPAGEGASDQYQTFDPNAAGVDTRASSGPAIKPTAADPFTTAAPSPSPEPDTTTDPYATAAPVTPKLNRAADLYQTVDPSTPPTDPNQTIDPSTAHAPVSQAETAPDDIFWPTEDDKPPLPKVPGYEILSILGQGGMGVVYRARQQGLKRLVALKMIRNAALAGAADLARFQIEAEALATLQHPNIVQIYEVGKVDSLPYFSLEYVDGGCLAKSVGREPQEARWSAEMMVTLSRAMHAAHTKNIIHRDLKPANVLLSKDGAPKITDFGLAKRVESGKSSGQTESGALLGTPCYMAPEQARGDIENTGALADVYALGAMLYEMLTGRPPFLGTTPMETVLQVVNEDPVPPTRLNPKAPRDLETICLKAMHKDATRRYENAGTLADDLRRWLDGEPIVARPASVWERGWKWTKRRPFVALSIAAGILLLFAVVWNAQVRAQVAKRDLQEERRNGKDKATMLDLLNKSEVALTGANWQDAEQNIVAARELVKSNSALGEFSDEVEKLASRANEGRSTRGKVDTFTAHYNETLLRHSQAAGQEAGDAGAITRREARSALDVFGDSSDTPEAAAFKSPYIKESERRAIEGRRYELLLILADAEGRGGKEQASKALQLLERAPRLGPPTQAYYRRLAHYQKQLGNATAADEAERRAEATAPTTAVDFFLLGEQAHQRGDWTGAIVQFEQALRREPDYFWAHYYIGLCALNAQQFARTEAEMGTCVHLRPAFVWPYLVRALARAELGHKAHSDTNLSRADRQRQAQIAFEGGEADLAQAEPALGTVKNDRYNWLVNRGLLRVRAERFADAEKDLREASKLKPAGVEAYATLAMAFQNQQRWADAIEQVDAALKVLDASPQNNTTYHRQSSLYRQRAFYERERGDTTATLRDLDTVITREEKRHTQGLTLASDVRPLAQDHYERGRLHYQEKRYMEALTDAQRVSELTPGDARATRLQAGIFYELKRYPEAVAAFDAYLGKENGKRTPGVYAGRGLARWRQRDYRGAIEDFTEALALESDEALGERETVQLHSDRGWIYLLDGDAPRLALDDFNEVLKLKPDNADALAGRGYARIKTGDYLRAVADADEAVRCAPKEARIHYLAARTYAQAADRAEADTRQRLHRELAVKYESRALALLQLALNHTPTAQRADYWRNTLRKDRALVPLHRNAGFVKLDKVYGSPEQP